MNHLLNQSRNKKILVISFQSLSSITSNSSTNVFELFASFKAANALNQWNMSLVQAVQSCVLVGHIDPHVIMLGGSDNYLDVLKLAWMKQILKPPLGFSIQYLGELCNFLVSKTPQCSNADLEDALCKCICELVNTGLPSNLKYIMRNIGKFLAVSSSSGEVTFPESAESFLSVEMINTILEGLQQKGLVYNTGHGYNVMTPDKLQVAKWLGNLPDTHQLLVANPPNRHSDTSNPNKETTNTEDCQSCNDLNGVTNTATHLKHESSVSSQAQQHQVLVNNKHYATTPTNPAQEHTITQQHNNSNNINQLDANSNNKIRMFCAANPPKKELPKRPNYNKYESAGLMAKIICGMKRLKVHLPPPQSTVPNSQVPNSANTLATTHYSTTVVNNNHHNSTNLDSDDNSQDYHHLHNHNAYFNYQQQQQQHNQHSQSNSQLNSRLSQSMYAFNRTELSPNLDPQCCISPVPNQQQNNHHNNNMYSYLSDQSNQPAGPMSRLSYTVYPNSPVNTQTGTPTNMFIFDDEQRCCSELMLTNNHHSTSPLQRPPTATPYLCSVMPLTNNPPSNSAGMTCVPQLPAHKSKQLDENEAVVVAAAAAASHQAKYSIAPTTGITNNNNNSHLQTINSSSHQHHSSGNNRYLSPFPTCDSGFNSVHGGGLLAETEAETIQSKTSSPPDAPKKSTVSMISPQLVNYQNNQQQMQYRAASLVNSNNNNNNSSHLSQHGNHNTTSGGKYQNTYSSIYPSNNSGPCAWQNVSLASAVSDNIYQLQSQHCHQKSPQLHTTNILTSNSTILTPLLESHCHNNSGKAFNSHR